MDKNIIFTLKFYYNKGRIMTMENKINEKEFFEDLQKKMEIVELETLVEDVKASKKKVKFKIALDVINTIASSVLTGFCINTAVKVVKDDEIGIGFKGLAISSAVACIGIQTENIYKTATKIKDLNELNKKYKPVMNLIENVSRLENPNRKSETLIEAQEKISNATSISEACDIALAASKEIENKESL